MQTRLLVGVACVMSVGCSAQTPSGSARSRTDAVVTQAGTDSPTVAVLVYHSIARHHAGQTIEQRVLDVDPVVFQSQMEELVRKNYTAVPFGDVVDAIASHRPLPPRAVAITFDDGWHSQLTGAVPVLRRLHLTATFFVATDEIESGPTMMTWAELRQLKQEGMTIGAHSRTHPDLTDKGIPLSAEIGGSRQDIERYLGFVPDLFAYPFGAYDAKVIAVVRAAGFRGARALAVPQSSTPNVFAIRGVQVTDDMTAFERALSGRR